VREKSRGRYPTEIIQKIVRPKYPGPTPSFSLIHIYKTLVVLGSEGQVGRKSLSRKISLGEGATRTIIEHLKREGMIKTSKGGCSLLKKGEKIFRLLSKKIPAVSDLAIKGALPSKHVTAALVKNAAQKIKMGIEQRDAAVRAGAEGAITLVFRGGKYEIPGEPFGVDLNSLFAELSKKFSLEDEDVVIIAWADDRMLAERGAFVSALETAGLI